MLALFKKSAEKPPLATLTSSPAPDASWLKPRGDAYVRIGGRDYPLRAWSPTAFHAVPYDGDLVPRQTARVTMVVRDFHDRDGGVTLTEEVTVISADSNGLIARWRPLAPAKRSMLLTYYARKKGH